MKNILFLGETYRADAQSWIKGIEINSGHKIKTMEISYSDSRVKRGFYFLIFFNKILFSRINNKFDIVLAERATSYGFFSLFVKAKLKVVAQQGITDAFPESGFSGFYKRIIQRIVYKNVNLIHAWGNVMTFAMLNSGAPPNKIFVLPKGINLDRFRFSYLNLSEFKIPKLSLIVTRSFYEIYRHEDILKSVAKLRDEGIKINVMLVGEGPEKEHLTDLSRKLKLGDQVKFLGRISNDELPKLLVQSRLYVAFPITEGVSSSLFEAMAVGCFPIVSDLPANHAFISHKKNGLLVPINNITKLADAIRFAIENPDIVEGAIKFNRDYIEKHANFQLNMTRIYNKYLELLAQKSA